MLAPLVRRTWALKAHTPTLVCDYRHDRLSVIAGLSLSVERRRIGLYFSVHRQNVTADEVEAFLRQVQRSLRRRLIVVMDRWSVHRKAGKALAGDRRFEIEWLPPYAPELNPVEYAWSHTKYGDLANYVPDDLWNLQWELDWSIRQTQTRPELLRSFFHAAELEIG
jgi:transposase